MKSYFKEKILAELAEGDKTLWELLDSWEGSLKDFVDGLNELHGEGKIAVVGKYIRLKAKGERKKFSPYRCPKCSGKGILQGFPEEFVKKFRKLLGSRPFPDARYDQGYMQPEDVLARVAFMHHHGDVEGRSIILIGDDDFLSLALAMTGLPSRVLVLDIDERIGEFLTRVSREIRHNVEFAQHDVSEPLPRELRGKFDVFVTDPLETISGLRAFLSRGASALRRVNSAGYFGLTTLEAGLEKWFWVQGFLHEMNFVITDILRGYSRYSFHEYGEAYEKTLLKCLSFEYKEKSNLPWYKSAFIRVESVGRVKPKYESKKLGIEILDEENLTSPISSKVSRPHPCAIFV